MKTELTIALSLFSLLAFLSVTSPTDAAERKTTIEAAKQRAACDARCREDHQGNQTALDACLRDCGAIGPARPGIPGAGPGVSGQSKTVKSSKSNSSEKLQEEPANPPPEPAEAVNLNSSKSNVYRQTSQAGETDPCTAEAQTDCD